MLYTVHEILQARILEWLGFPFSRDFPNPGIKPRSHALQVDSLPAEPQGKPKNTAVGRLSLLQWIFPIQESNQGHLHCRQNLYQLSYQRSLHMCVCVCVCIKLFSMDYYRILSTVSCAMRWDVVYLFLYIVVFI